MESNGWDKYARNVLAELKRHDKWLEKLDLNLNNHVKTLSNRIIAMEVQQKMQTRLYYIMLTAVIGIFGMVFIQMVL